jgi:hypothetical protein
MLSKAAALKLAIAAIDAEIRRLDFDANLYERLQAEHGEKAHQKRARLREARAILAELVDKQLTLFNK